ncbi:hypothetical protein KFL_009190025 [Klebsormidium nitens]|uniref:Uncharacterized protein n=1 Tax=Klebsormidium nitens TaxID=105231 RepID=A0A1Y1IN50_KLENI|nr:hypothetical protein KFL_009190025 [Klebsormidium nitens]|eukprot:GAQ92083.1 hypothetical protein KFL_009190025 [Klebsormidium nitens]
MQGGAQGQLRKSARLKGEAPGSDTSPLPAGTSRRPGRANEILAPGPGAAAEAAEQPAEQAASSREAALPAAPTSATAEAHPGSAGTAGEQPAASQAAGQTAEAAGRPAGAGLPDLAASGAARPAGPAEQPAGPAGEIARSSVEHGAAVPVAGQAGSVPNSSLEAEKVAKVAKMAETGKSWDPGLHNVWDLHGEEGFDIERLQALVPRFGMKPGGERKKLLSEMIGLANALVGEQGAVANHGLLRQETAETVEEAREASPEETAEEAEPEAQEAVDVGARGRGSKRRGATGVAAGPSLERAENVEPADVAALRRFLLADIGAVDEDDWDRRLFPALLPKYKKYLSQQEPFPNPEMDILEEFEADDVFQPSPDELANGVVFRKGGPRQLGEAGRNMLTKWVEKYPTERTKFVMDGVEGEDEKLLGLPGPLLERMMQQISEGTSMEAVWSRELNAEKDGNSLTWELGRFVGYSTDETQTTLASNAWALGYLVQLEKKGQPVLVPLIPGCSKDQWGDTGTAVERLGRKEAETTASDRALFEVRPRVRDLLPLAVDLEA